ncbi:MAG TPA: flagellar export protein FliJ [Candidatus Cybelea sp.]|jgi:flagellar export protein FliJ|nr:flagellar export protein FliJ [Candidatus Cybelea sp.]
MRAFRFTLEAVRILRQRQEHEALEDYIRALLVRQQALNSLEAIDQCIGRDFAEMRILLAGSCTAAQAAQAQNFHVALEQKREECATALGEAERLVNGASKAMLTARRQREMVDVFREKQQALHQRLELREEQKIMDEFAIRRVTALSSARTDKYHD